MPAKIAPEDQLTRLRGMRDRQKLGNSNSLVLNQAGFNLRAVTMIAELLPREDEWQSAAGTVEAIAEILDRHGIERPDHYDAGTDIR